ncbi:MAG: AEC family transporter [Chlamydiales bacterium]|nr:AEC family transporter [Chlamydiales bacterium]
MGIITIVLPVFVVVILGWLFKTWNLIKEDAVKHYYLFVKMVAAPALLLLSLGSTTFDNIWNWRYIACLGVPVLGLFVVAVYVIRVILRKQTPMAAITALAFASSNVGYIGLPLLYGVFGRRAMIPAALAIVIQMLLLSLAIFFLDMSATEKSSVQKSFKKAVSFFLFHPLMIAIIVGVLYSLTSFPIPAGIAKFLHVLEIAIVPLALFTIGLQIDVSSFGKRFQSSFLIWFIKLVVFPAIVLWVVNNFYLNPMGVIVAVIVAALPYASAISYVGEQYASEKGGKLSHIWGSTRDTVTVISLVTLFVWFIILFQLFPGEFRSSLAFF